MTDRIPVKATIVSGAAVGLAEFASGDTVPVANGGTGVTTSTGTGDNVLSNGPALTNPTVTTQASTDNSTKAASTAWAKLGFVVLLAATGYIKFPDWMLGVIIQWGVTDTSSGASTVTLPLTFPTAARAALACLVTGTTSTVMWGATISALSTTSLTVQKRFYNGSTLGAATEPAYWIAVGY